MKYIYGPVHSRRLGFSLGISPVPYKVCNFDCIYCQLGNTTKKTSQRKEYIRIEDILSELTQLISNFDYSASRAGRRNLHIDYITISGTGEPLLNLGISTLIRGIKEITSIPIALITNASLIKDRNIRKEILGADLILPSLDTISKETFRMTDRPCPEINIEDIIDGLIDLRREFSGKIYLEIMIVKGINDNTDDFIKFKKVILKIEPDRIHLNTPKRHTTEPGVLVPDEKTLNRIKKILGPKCKII